MPRYMRQALILVVSSPAPRKRGVCTRQLIERLEESPCLATTTKRSPSERALEQGLLRETLWQLNADPNEQHEVHAIAKGKEESLRIE
jgi:hypothetical protein